MYRSTCNLQIEQDSWWQVWNVCDRFDHCPHHNLRKYRSEWYWWQSYFGDFMTVEETGWWFHSLCCWLLQVQTSKLNFKDRSPKSHIGKQHFQLFLVISNFSPTYFVSKFRHQHRLSLARPRSVWVPLVSSFIRLNGEFHTGDNRIWRMSES